MCVLSVCVLAHSFLTRNVPRRDRARAALIGAFVADAATMPLHWIYSPSQIKSIIHDKHPEFWAKPSSPFYKYEVGELSPYGAEAFFLLRSIVEHGRVHVRTARSCPCPRVLSSICAQRGRCNLQGICALALRHSCATLRSRPYVLCRAPSWSRILRKRSRTTMATSTPQAKRWCAT